MQTGACIDKEILELLQANRYVKLLQYIVKKKKKTTQEKQKNQNKTER